VAVGDGMFRDEAEERCHKWAPFLINHFPKEDQFEWQGTFFYTWIIDKHPVHACDSSLDLFHALTSVGYLQEASEESCY
jgi:hypothetical protein